MHDYIITEKGKPLSGASKALILLHGRGGSAKDIIRLADEFSDGSYYVAAPQANNNAWYPFSFLEPAEKNEPWLTSAIGIVNRLINEISETLGTENIYIMGFSQGACLAVETASRNAVRYAGIAAFSGGLIGKVPDRSLYKGNFNNTKVFIGNSDNDPHIPLDRCEFTRDTMESLGARVNLKIYPGMGHTITRDEIRTVKSDMFYFTV